MELRPPLHLGVVAIEKVAFVSPSTKVTNFYWVKNKDASMSRNWTKNKKLE